MACQLSTIALFFDIENVKKLLFTIKHTRDDRVKTDSWVWPEDDLLVSTMSTLPHKTLSKDINWLQDCHTSLSSTSELLVISHKTTMVILTSKWNSQEGDVKTKYHVSWHGSLCQQPDEEITSVLCLPIISQGKSTHCGPDWTCIVVGFSTGCVRFYTENCCLLTSEILHNEPVTFLKCQAFQTPQYLTSREPAEEIYVVYSSAVCIVPGFGLFQTLRACRNQLARIQANCKEVIEAPPLAFKKWGFQDQDLITDCEIVGPATANSFDHLLTASICGGFNTWYRSSAPQTSLIVASGKKPFVGFHYALEGGAPPVLTDVAKVMANKLKSAIGHAVPGWLLGGRRNQNSEKAKEVPLEPADPMGCRFGLCDHWRQGDGLVMSPNRNLCVVCDSLGRILLVDNQKGIAVRMWKGYRDAQCGWLEVKEDHQHRNSGSRSSSHLRTALFLVIYSPKKGIIEIWTMQQGQRIATFPVSKSGRLLYTDYGLMGLNNVQIKGGNKSQCPCVFLDPSGFIKEITVPFHFALSDKNSKRVRDLHLLKKLKTFIREEEFDEEKLIGEAEKVVKELKTNEVRCQTLEMLASNRLILPHVLEVVLSVALDKWFISGAEPEQLDPGVKPLYLLTQKLQCLITLYRFIDQLNEKPPDYTTVVNSNLNPSVLLTKLHTPEREVNSLLNLVATMQLMKSNEEKSPKQNVRVTFESKATTFVDFLSCFECNLSGQESVVIMLKKTDKNDQLVRIGELLYQGTLYSDSNIGEWKDAVINSCIEPSHLMQLALLFWLNHNQGVALETEMLRFAELLKSICSLADVDDICVECNQVSPWWLEVRNHLIDSTNPFMALTSSIVCRSVALEIERTKDQASNLNETCDEPMDVDCCNEDELTGSRSSTGEWENVSNDTCQWSLLISQLEDVSLLSAVLRQKPPTDDKDSSKYKIPFECKAISLSSILSRGKGSVSELTASWLSSTSINPYQLVDSSDIEFNKEEMPEKEVKNIGIKEGKQENVEVGSEATSVDELNVKILSYLSILKKHFPYSLSSSVLLSNLCWEYLLAWHKNVEELQALDCALVCLKSMPSSLLKLGLCSLVWSMHLKQHFEWATLLIQKVGRIPKERLCRQEVGLSEIQLPQFIDKCLSFFLVFMEACCINDPFPTHYEELWPSNVNGPPPLVELALSQAIVNYDLLHLHYELALSLHMLLVFNVKFPRPISSLFDNSGQAAFYADLSTNPQLPSHNPDSKLIGNRTQFLFRVISAAMQTIHLPDEIDIDSEDLRLGATQAIQWMSKCHELASLWGVSNDLLRRHQICELYSSGFDRLAEEVIPAVVDMTQLASQLLLIVGQRMRHVVLSSPDLCDQIAKLSPRLSTWLDSMPENNLKSTNCRLSDTSQLLVHVMQHLPEDHQEYNLALHLVDAVHSFNDNIKC